MKKLFIFICMSLLPVTMMATDYKDRLIVDINGNKVEQMATISVDQQPDGKYTLSLQNFILNMGGTEMAIGNITLKDVDGVSQDERTLLTASQTVQITNGTEPTNAMWIGPSLGAVPVKMAARLAYDKLTTAITIYMAGMNINVYFGKDNTGYQIPNADFEAFRTEDEPVGWHSFGSATGSFAQGFYASFLPKIGSSSNTRTGKGKCVSIKSKSVFFTIANGTMSTGRMNAGAMTASDTKNNAYIDMSKTDTDSNGDPFYTHMVGRPDSLVVWINFKQGTPNTKYPNATISAAITDGTYYQDPEDKAYTNVLAKAKNDTIATTQGQWKRVSIPFNYVDKSIDGKALLVTISTNAAPGQGSGNDEMLVDDIELIYNVYMEGLAINGKTVSGISKEKTVYEATANLSSLTPNDFSVTTNNPKTPMIVTIGENTGNRQTAEITLFSEDLRTSATYTLNLTHDDNAPTGIDSVKGTVNNSRTQVYNLSGQRVLHPQVGKVYIMKQADGTAKKTVFK